MPYIEKPEEDEEGLQAGATPGALAAPAAMGGTRQLDAAAPAASQNAGKAPGRFVNFSRYFNANADGARAAGTRVAAGLEKQGQGVQSDLQKRQGAFQTGVTNALGAAATPLGTPATPAQQTGMGGQTPTGLKGSQTQGLDGKPNAPPPAAAPQNPVTWAGPNALSEGEGWDALVSRAGKAAADAAGATTSTGLQGLLQEGQKANVYGPGKSRFDAGLLGVSSGDKFAALKERFSGLPRALGAADTASVATSDAAKKQVGAYNEKVAVENARVAAARKAELDAEIAKRNATGNALAGLAGGLTPGKPLGRVKPNNMDEGYPKLGYGLTPSSALSAALKDSGSSANAEALYGQMSPDEYAQLSELIKAVNAVTSTKDGFMQPKDRDALPDVAAARAAMSDFLKSLVKKYGGK